MFEYYYTLEVPEPYPWYVFVPLAVMWVILWIINCRDHGLWKGTWEAIKAAYKVFIADRTSLKPVDIFITGLILFIIARPLM